MNFKSSHKFVYLKPRHIAALLEHIQVSEQPNQTSLMCLAVDMQGLKDDVLELRSSLSHVIAQEFVVSKTPWIFNHGTSATSTTSLMDFLTGKHSLASMSKALLCFMSDDDTFDKAVVEHRTLFDYGYASQENNSSGLTHHANVFQLETLLRGLHLFDDESVLKLDVIEANFPSVSGLNYDRTVQFKVHAPLKTGGDLCIGVAFPWAPDSFYTFKYDEFSRFVEGVEAVFMKVMSIYALKNIDHLFSDPPQNDFIQKTYVPRIGSKTHAFASLIGKRLADYGETGDHGSRYKVLYSIRDYFSNVHHGQCFAEVDTFLSNHRPGSSEIFNGKFVDDWMTTNRRKAGERLSTGEAIYEGKNVVITIATVSETQVECYIIQVLNIFNLYVSRNINFVSGEVVEEGYGVDPAENVEWIYRIEKVWKDGALGNIYTELLYKYVELGLDRLVELGFPESVIAKPLSDFI